VVVGRKNLTHVFRAREVVLVGVQVSVGGHKSEYVPLLGMGAVAAHPRPLPALLIVMVIVVVHVVDVGEWCGVVMVVASKGGW
jgi:hypothetical protein